MNLIKHLLSLAAIATALTASAQADLFDSTENTRHLGVRAGLDISTTSSNDDYYNNGFGFHVGAAYHLPIAMNFYVEPGLSVFYDTFGLELTTEGTTPDGNPYIYNQTGSIRNFGLRIPVMLGYHFDFTDDLQIAPFTGPQLNLSLSAQQYWEGKKIGSLFHQGFRHADLQWVIGLCATYSRYYVAISEAIGVTRAIHINSDGFKRNTFAITLGYNF